MAPDTATCRYCGARIQFAITAGRGRPMPIDPDPDPAGNLAVYRDTTDRLRARVLAADEVPEPHEHRGISHFATCTSRTVRQRKGH